MNVTFTGNLRRLIGTPMRAAKRLDFACDYGDLSTHDMPSAKWAGSMSCVDK
jgi:hypothetical protein